LQICADLWLPDTQFDHCGKTRICNFATREDKPRAGVPFLTEHWLRPHSSLFRRACTFARRLAIRPQVRIASPPAEVQLALASQHAPFGAPGFPGAGNVVTQQLCLGILETAGIRLEHPALRGGAPGSAQQATFFIGSRHARVMGLFRAVLTDEWIDHSFLNHRGLGHVDFMAVNGSRFIIVTDSDMGLHLNTLTHSTHELPSRACYETYEDYGFGVIPVIRHPLDLLLSFAQKGALTASDSCIINSPTASILGAETYLLQAYRNLMVEKKLADSKWLHGIAIAIRRYYEPIADMIKEYPPSRFEDVLENPKQAVASLAVRLGIKIDDLNTNRVASMVGIKEFRAGHFNNPVAGKWRRKFKAEWIDRLRSVGLFEPFSRLGYSVPTADDLVSEMNDMSSQVLLQKCGISAAVGADPEPLMFYDYLALASTFDPIEHARNLGLEDIVYSTRHWRHRILSNDPELLRSISSALTARVLAEMGQTTSQAVKTAGCDGIV
jgi:hypothetical protein